MKKVAKVILKILFYAFCAGIPIALLFKYISPSSFWIAPFLSYSLPLWMFGLSCMLFLKTYRKKWKLYVVLMLIGIWGCRDNFSLFPGSQEKGDVSVLSYNVRLFDYYNWLERKSWDDWAPRTDNGAVLDSIYSNLKNQNTDIICFQEYFNQSRGDYQTKKQLRRLGYKYFHKKNAFKVEKNQYGMATFSKFPIVKREEFGFKTRSNNGILVTDIKVGKDTLRVFNAHLHSFKFGKEDYKYLNGLKENGIAETDIEKSRNIISRLKHGFTKRAKQVDLLLNLIKQSPYAVILCGDFNEIPNSNLYWKVSKSLDDAFLDKGFGMGDTHINDAVLLRIDYIFHSKGIATTSFEIPQFKLSDHYPLRAEFKFTNND